MPVPCPCCKATNETGPNCRRCKADLSLLFDLEERRMRLIEAARDLAREARLQDSLAILEQAAQLRSGADVHRLRAALSLLARDFPAALQSHQAATSRDQP